MDHFDHERLDVYQAALKFVVVAHRLIDAIDGYRPLKDQLHRASTSIINNIAEGAGEFATAEKRRFYRMARRSATESAAILDTVRSLQLAEDATRLERGRALLLRIVRMLKRLVGT